MRGWLQLLIPTNTLILKILRILKILIPTVEDARRATILDTYQDPNPENLENPLNPDKKVGAVLNYTYLLLTN